MSNRITIDFTSEPDVLKRVRSLAKMGQRSIGKQLLFMCLPHLKVSTAAKQIEYGEQAR